MRPDGSNARLLATIPHDPSSPIFYPTVEGPVFAPGGGEIAYVLNPPQTVAGQPWLTEISLIDARTGRQRLIIPVSPHPLLPVPEPSVPVPLAFSPDGTELAFVAPNASRISIVKTSTGKPIRSIQAPTSSPYTAGVSGISWSIKGMIAFAFADGANTSIYTVRPSGAGLRQITQPPPGQSSGSTQTATVDLAPEWSPNGASLMFDRQVQTYDLCGGCGDSDTDHVEVMPADGGQPHLIWSGGTGSWSPDGKQIAVTSPPGGGIWIVGAQGGSRKQIAGPTWVQGSLPSISWQSVSLTAKARAH
jgi:Tol biopolymer transport system component